VHQFGGYKIQGRDNERREAVLRDAVAVEQAGAFAVVLEGIPQDLAGEISQRLAIPTIGIGAGMQCDGQVLVIHDMLGLFDDFVPKFVKRYADVKQTMLGAVKEFVGEVKERKFPAQAHSFK
jgi:3-methyl-2-oxobutanoate hydroxymethyltransferase